MDALVAATTATAATALVAILGPAARAGLVIACPGSTSTVAPAIIAAPGGARGRYPAPVVDLKASRVAALEAFASLRK